MCGGQGEIDALLAEKGAGLMHRLISAGKLRKLK
jgi:hypothetical protein